MDGTRGNGSVAPRRRTAKIEKKKNRNISFSAYFRDKTTRPLPGACQRLGSRKAMVEGLLVQISQMRAGFDETFDLPSSETYLSSSVSLGMSVDEAGWLLSRAPGGTGDRWIVVYKYLLVPVTVFLQNNAARNKQLHVFPESIVYLNLVLSWRDISSDTPRTVAIAYVCLMPD